MSKLGPRAWCSTAAMISSTRLSRVSTLNFYPLGDWGFDETVYFCFAKQENKRKGWRFEIFSYFAWLMFLWNKRNVPRNNKTKPTQNKPFRKTAKQRIRRNVSQYCRKTPKQWENLLHKQYCKIGEVSLYTMCRWKIENIYQLKFVFFYNEASKRKVVQRHITQPVTNFGQVAWSYGDPVSMLAAEIDT